MQNKNIAKYPAEVQQFINYFLESAYQNMLIEDEAIYSKDELYDRYSYFYWKLQLK
jgi:hypothetical protein